MPIDQPGRPSSTDPMRLNLFWPLSGDVEQSILPWTWWLRVMGQWGFININLGRTSDPELERRIIRDVASYGRQLGRLSEALDALIEATVVEEQPAAPQLDRAKLKKDEHIAAIVEFRQMLEEIKEVKKQR